MTTHHSSGHHHSAVHHEEKSAETKPQRAKPVIDTTPPAPPAPTPVSDAEVETAYNEFVHPRNGFGDGCPGCGYGNWWGKHQLLNNRHFHMNMLRNVLEAVRKL